MFLATQYYRPPFPERKYWKTDIELIKKTGLDAIQLWACWGWIESSPGKYNFNDYDELINLADKKGLKVIISTIAEIQPFWIHREVPDSHLVDCMGNKVISSLRIECNVGLAPGGCFDNPKIQELMGKFLETISKRYSNAKNLILWDCWNELRWNVNADGFVCYCPHTIRNFRDYLKEKYKDLDGLNSVWKRRYTSWEDVMPGKLPGRTYTEMMEFLRFLVWRAGKHMEFRAKMIKKSDPLHPVSAHCAAPSIMSLGGGEEQILCRGNDWDHADKLDGFGSSHFPAWEEFIDKHIYGIRLESIRSATHKKITLVSELQGGSARYGIQANKPVIPEIQQLWVWNGYARKAKGVIFWCWRDEVFGSESSGFGITGNDGFKEGRLKELKKTSDFLDKYNDLLDNYIPDDPKVGVLFEQDNFFLVWSQYGNEEITRKLAGNNLYGYLYALEKLQISYEIVESNHTDILDKLKLLIMPFPLVVNEKLHTKLYNFVKNGGTILVEAELDSYDNLGFYRYPTGERKFAIKFDIQDKGRRLIKEECFKINFGTEKFLLKPSFFYTPLKIEKSKILSKTSEGETIAGIKNIGKGKVIALGSFFGNAYFENKYSDFEKFIFALVNKFCARPEIIIKPEEKTDNIKWKTGLSGNTRLIFITNFDNNDCKVNIVTKDVKISVLIKGLSWNVFTFDKKELKKL